jgi:gliding motility-associated lipoprotein GldK
VGIDWDAAVYFSNWRSAYLNDYRKNNGDFPMPAFRLPSEAEWEYAARGGRDMAKYPWGNPYIRNSKGCMLANFKPGRGNFYDDGFAYSSPVQSYFPNDYGLYDMAGNVSEWCLDDFNPASVPTVWDLNPQYIDKRTDPESSSFDPRVPPKKVVRGGSWKDVAYYLETGTRTFEFRDSTRAYIGFRCAMTHLGRSSGQEF